MAKRGPKSGDRQNKSAAIREYITANADAGPTAIAKELNEAHGWDISAAYVSTIKNKMGGKRAGGKRRGRAPGAKSGVNNQVLMEAKKLADQTGSIEAAKQALDKLSEFQVAR
jgi:hypothetical protein